MPSNNTLKHLADRLEVTRDIFMNSTNISLDAIENIILNNVLDQLTNMINILNIVNREKAKVAKEFYGHKDYKDSCFSSNNAQ